MNCRCKEHEWRRSWTAALLVLLLLLYWLFFLSFAFDWRFERILSDLFIKSVTMKANPRRPDNKRRIRVKDVSISSWFYSTKYLVFISKLCLTLLFRLNSGLSMFDLLTLIAVMMLQYVQFFAFYFWFWVLINLQLCLERILANCKRRSQGAVSIWSTKFLGWNSLKYSVQKQMANIFKKIADNDRK